VSPQKIKFGDTAIPVPLCSIVVVAWSTAKNTLIPATKIRKYRRYRGKVLIYPTSGAGFSAVVCTSKRGDQAFGSVPWQLWRFGCGEPVWFIHYQSLLMNSAYLSGLSRADRAIRRNRQRKVALLRQSRYLR